jgi:hypothetical protein
VVSRSARPADVGLKHPSVGAACRTPAIGVVARKELEKQPQMGTDIENYCRPYPTSDICWGNTISEQSDNR